MKLICRAWHALSMVVATALLAGCFSYHREVERTTAQNPPPSSTTTTTTTNDNGTVQRQSTTTYSNP